LNRPVEYRDDNTRWTRRGVVGLAASALVGLLAPSGLGARVRSRRPTGRMARRTPAGRTSPVSRPDLSVPEIVVDVPASGTAPGYLFLAPFVITKNTPAGAQYGPLIVDDAGEPVWFLPVSGKNALNFRVQRYRGRHVLTWYEGEVLGPYGGDYVVFDPTYHEVARVKARHRYSGDLHEFLLTTRNTALICIYSELKADLTSVGGSKDARLVEGIVQELALPSGKVLFEWHSFDHVPVTESYRTEVTTAGNVDYFHLNSIAVDLDGDLLISSRHTSTVYKVDRRNGKIKWRLGGKRSDFTLGPGATFEYQHDVRRHPDGTLTVFDNGAWLPGAAGSVEPASRALRLSLDTKAMKADLLASFEAPDKPLAWAMGNMQQLPDGGYFVGWGTAGSFTEFAPDGRVRLDARFGDGSITYRAFRFPWIGRPTGRPAAAITGNDDGTMTVHASWNGATRVAHWQVRVGAGAKKPRAIATAARAGFETAITIPATSGPVSVAALDSRRRVLGISTPALAPS
jgi:hypothetical protein